MIICEDKSLTLLASENTNGLGVLQVIDPQVVEALNGEYELTFDVLITDPHFKDLEVGSIVKTTANDRDGLQMFRIYSIGKNISGVVTCKGEHISYELAKIPVSPFTSTGAVLTVNTLKGHVIGSTVFDMTTNIENTTSQFVLDKPRSFRECLGGWEGSILDVFRGEYHWNNLLVEMLNRRGSDNGVRIAYGKNLTDFRQEENIAEVYTSVLGYAMYEEQCVMGTVYNKITTANPRVLIVDLTGEFGENEVPTTETVNLKAQEYAESHDIEVPSVNLTVSFIHLWQSDEYKETLPIERVQLGDTVHVYFEKLGVETAARVIKTTWNPNTERYDSIELGSPRANLNTVINSSVDQSVNNAIDNIKFDFDTSKIDEQLAEITQYISSGLGLYKTVDDAGRIYLHDQPSLALSQKQYRITSNGFEMSNDYGQTWNSGWTIDGNAVFHELSSNTLTALEIYGSYIQGSQIVFGDPSIQGSKYVVAQPYYDENDNPLGVRFAGTGNVEIMPTGQFQVKATDGTDDYVMTLDENGFNLESDGNYIKMTSNGKINIGNDAASFEINGVSNTTDLIMKNGTSSFIEIYHNQHSKHGIHLKSDTIELTDSASYLVTSSHIMIDKTSGVEIGFGTCSLTMDRNNNFKMYSVVGGSTGIEMGSGTNGIAIKYLKTITYGASAGLAINDTSNNKAATFGNRLFELNATTLNLGGKAGGSSTGTSTIYLGNSGTTVNIKGRAVSWEVHDGVYLLRGQ